MAFPANSTEMKNSGYVFDNDATCRGCGDDIEWWITPKGSKIPMNPMDSASTPAISHFTTCSDVESFRKGK
jgi:hypothetical protein